MIEQELIKLVEPSINAKGFELWGLDYFVSKGKSRLQIYIENQDKVTVDDCGQITSEVSYLLDVHDIIKNQYILEVSSPGINRKLYKPSQFKLYLHQEVIVKLKDVIDEKRKIKGILQSAESESFIVVEQMSENKYEISYDQIQNVQLDVLNTYKISKKS